MPAIDAVRGRRVDAAIVYTVDPERLTRTYAKDLAADVLRQEAMVLLLPAAQDATPDLDVRDLADRTWFTTGTDTRFPGMNATLADLWSAAEIVPPKRVVPTLGVARMYVEAGLGIAPANASAITGLSTAVRAITTRHDLPSMYATLIRSRNVPVSNQLAELIATAHEHVSRVWSPPPTVWT